MVCANKVLRLTIKCGVAYRIPDLTAKAYITESRGFQSISGELVDRLGEYEDLGTVEELKAMKKELNKK